MAGAIADEQACLAATTIADNNELLGVGGWLCDGCVAGICGSIRAHCAIAVALAGSADGLADWRDRGHGRLDALLAA